VKQPARLFVPLTAASSDRRIVAALISSIRPIHDQGNANLQC
jgi:hypothetical protein